MKTEWLKPFIGGCLVFLLVQCSSMGTTPKTGYSFTPTVKSVNELETEPKSTAPSQLNSLIDPHMTPITPPLENSKLQNLIEMAQQDLSQRLAITVTDISLIEAKKVVWPDGSLGCPKPGMAYADVLTPGYLIKLKADNKEYEYHAGRGISILYCENPSPPISGTPEDF